MENIAPLAKILAEANGIDWRRIQGTGAGGMIVEQDILNFLTRVMSGEEEPPSTPVDLPPPDWEGDMAAMPSMDAAVAALSQAGVESDITDFVKSGAGTMPTPAPTADVAPVAEAAPEPEPVAADDDMDFELDEGDTDTSSLGDDFDTPPAVAASAPVAEPVPAPAPHTFQDQPDTRLTSTAWDAPAAPTPAPAPEPAAPAASYTSAPVETPVQPEPTPPPAAPEAPAAQQGSGFGLGGFLSRLYRRNDGAEAQPQAPAPEPTPPAPTPEPAVPAASYTYAQPAPVETPAQPEPAPAPVQPEPVIPEPEVPAASYTYAEPAPVEAINEPAETPAASLGEPVITSPAPQDTPESAPLVADQLRPEPVPAEDEPTDVHAPFATETPAFAGAAAATPAPSAAVNTGTARVARRGTLRRTLAAGAATEAAAHLGDALGTRVPLALLVGRAAARSGDQTVALARVDGEDVSAIQADLRGDFRANTQALALGTPGVGADLLVIDGASLENGEVLFLDGPALTVAHDASGVTLTLTGMSASEAARVLDSVERELQTPIKLLF